MAPLDGNRALPVEKFGGLNLQDDPEEVAWAGAIDIQNVDLRDPTRPRSRDGSEKFSTAAGATPYTRLFSYRGSSSRLIATGTSLTDARSSAGATLTSMAVGPVSSAVMFGTPASTIMYLALASTSLTIRKFDGTSFSAPTAMVDTVSGKAMPQTALVAVTPWDNRLVCANGGATSGPGGTASSPSTLHFSDPGNGESYQSNNFVQLSPGDGEQITALVAWRELLFVFKQTKFYVFTGTTTDGTGNPIFNYRGVNTGVGAPAGSSITGASVAGGPDGVYFSNRNGVWRTTGGEPVKISRAIDPLFRREFPQFWTASQYSGSALPGAVAIAEMRVIVACSGFMFVYDIDTGLWSYWQSNAMSSGNAIVAHSFVLDDPQVFYWSMGSSNDVARFAAGASTDTGAVSTITSYYRSGFASPGGPGAESTVRETELNGSGLGGGGVRFAWSRDFGALDSPSTVTVGSSASRGYHRVAKAGETLSWQISNVSGVPWQINRIVAFIREVRGPGEKTT